jgi:hypothetical protein
MSDDDENLLLDDNDMNENQAIVELAIDDLKVDLNFDSEEVAVKSIENWSFKSLRPLAKIRYRRGKTVNGERVKGRRCLACPHGIQRTKTGTGDRPGQRYKFTKCPVKVNLNEQEDGSWEVTTCNLEHDGHPITSKLFYSHQQSRKLDDDDKEFVKGLLRVRANARNIEDVLTERTGKDFKTQDVRNLITRIKEDDENGSSVEDALGQIRDAGEKSGIKRKRNK